MDTVHIIADYNHVLRLQPYTSAADLDLMHSNRCFRRCWYNCNHAFIL